nr:hypothetical protein [Methylomarinum sp. Ch1-1]MDP4521293.1 hypothetical protein [Methylomarinum sp. Ch1-1]
MLKSLHKQLLNDYQQDFPLTPTPYRDIADSLGVDEEEVLSAMRDLSDQRLINRIGPIIRPRSYRQQHAGGDGRAWATLAAGRRSDQSFSRS